MGCSEHAEGGSWTKGEEWEHTMIRDQKNREEASYGNGVKRRSVAMKSQYELRCGTYTENDGIFILTSLRRSQSSVPLVFGVCAMRNPSGSTIISPVEISWPLGSWTAIWQMNSILHQAENRFARLDLHIAFYPCESCKNRRLVIVLG